MTARFTALATLLGAGVTAAAIAAAPAAFAQPACDQTNPSGAGQTGGGEVCQFPGNAEIDGKLPTVQPPGYRYGGTGGFPWDDNMFTL